MNLAEQGGRFEIDLIVLRHGDAGKPVSRSKQIDRTLTAASQREIKQIGKSISKLNIKFNTIATSPLKYVFQTASIIVQELDSKKQIMLWDELRPEGDPTIVYEKLSKLKKGSRVLLVGHGPFLTNMISEIINGGWDKENGKDKDNKTTKDKPFRINLKKGGFARIRVISFTPRIKGELRWLIPPKLASRLQF